jgi:uncharacterized protein YigA (DUF484 family)
MAEVDACRPIATMLGRFETPSYRRSVAPSAEHWANRTLSVKLCLQLALHDDPTSNSRPRPPLMTFTLDPAAVAQYLEDTPEFFEQHVDLLARIRLGSELGGRTVSLQERQMDVLRQKVKAMEMRLADLMRLAHENHLITEKFQSWTRSLLLARNDVDLPHTLISGLQSTFSVPQVTLRLWKEAATWLDEPAAVQSIAMLPLRVGAAPTSFGMLVLGSSDPARFSAEMATDFLVSIGETTSAALSCLLD